MLPPRDREPPSVKALITRKFQEYKENLKEIGWVENISCCMDSVLKDIGYPGFFGMTQCKNLARSGKIICKQCGRNTLS